MKKTIFSVLLLAVISMTACDSSSSGSNNNDSGSNKPQIVSVFPQDNASSVPVKTLIKITFNSVIDVSTLTGDTLLLKKGTDKISVTITCIDGNKIVVVTPDVVLDPGSSYSFTVSADVNFSDGTPVDPVTIEFTTEVIDMPVPDYQLGIIHNSATISFTTDTTGATIELGTSSDTGATAPDSWAESDSFTFNDNGIVKVFARAKKDGSYSALFSKVYTVQDSYPPDVSQAGTDALYLDDSSLVSWANGHVDYISGSEHTTSGFDDPAKAYGPAVASSYDVVCLGNAVYSDEGEVIQGMITLTFPNGISDGPGDDFAVFENSFNHTFLELGYVEVSSDGTNFVRFDTVSLTTDPVGGFGAVEPTKIYGFAGRYKQGYGNPFDLSDLVYSDEVRFGLVDLADIRYVRIVDVLSGNDTEPDPFRDYDSFGNKIYDPYKTVGTGGFDLDAVGVINEAD